MKGLKVDLEMVNMALLVVILVLVVVNCIKREKFIGSQACFYRGLVAGECEAGFGTAAGLYGSVR